MTKTMFASALLGAALLSTTAFAAESQIDVAGATGNALIQSSPVRTDDLNLTNRADQTELRARVNHAVASACTFSNSAVDTACAGDAKATASARTEALIAAANSGTSVARGAN
ncbi:UrcA family protein [Sphingomonas montanisoli]|uniref:UrcA family protein n=1 Tax=Sphingomonas montanisoli TaxID=2606412 RepID=A0A5D9C6H2_9SPHN|nr:UrcA family protein [Sphingomonas montanisoli]TZG27279.1 UrcA family protein [Sphingomonas montanisoli]